MRNDGFSEICLSEFFKPLARNTEDGPVEARNYDIYIISCPRSQDIKGPLSEVTVK